MPEAITYGDTVEEATRMADEALEVSLTFYTEKWTDLPTASAPKRGMRMIRIPALSEAKFKLYSALRSAVDIQHGSKLGQLEAAFAASASPLSLRLRTRRKPSPPLQSSRQSANEISRIIRAAVSGPLSLLRMRA